jgi:hypothetical protein
MWKVLVISGFLFLVGTSVVLGMRVLALQNSSPTNPVSAVITAPSPAPLPSQTNAYVKKPSVQGVATTDPDPIMGCNSKTGLIRVRKSVCLSYTDCPDGKGGYIFESQVDCKKLWDFYSLQMKNAAEQLGKAYNNQAQLQYQQINQNYQNFVNNQPTGQDIVNSALNNLPPNPTPINFSGFIKTETKTPDPNTCWMDMQSGQQVCPPSN